MIDADAPVSALTRAVTFENFNLGDPAVDQVGNPGNNDSAEGDRFDWDSIPGPGASELFIDNAHVQTGSKSARLVATQGQEKIAGGPGLVLPGAPFAVGTQLYVRVSARYPQAAINAGVNVKNGQKHIRLGYTGGLNTLYTWPNNGGGPVPTPTPNNHFASFGTAGLSTHPHSYVVFYTPNHSASGLILPDQFSSHEMYIKVGYDLATSEFRIWRDNLPCTGWALTWPNTFTPITAGGGYDFQTPMVENASQSLTGGMHYWTQWNGAKVGGQNQGVANGFDLTLDRIEICVNKAPPNVDPVSGFPFIGGL